MAEASDLPALVRASAEGDEHAWSELVQRFAHLVMAITRQYRLSPMDAQDVSQTVWLRLVEHLPAIREPAALAGWIITTTKHECQRQAKNTGRTVPVDPLSDPKLDARDTGDVDVDLLKRERHRVLLDGVAELPPHQQELLVLLATDPPLTYAEISQALNIPIGSIGPTRSRVLQKLRETAPVKRYIEATREGCPPEGCPPGGDRHALA